MPWLQRRWNMNYSQIMSPRPPLPRKVGGHDPPSSYWSAAPAEDDDELNTKNCSLVVPACKSGMFLQCKSMRFCRSCTTA